MSRVPIPWGPENSRILLFHWLKQQDQLVSQQMATLKPSSYLATFGICHKMNYSRCAQMSCYSATTQEAHLNPGPHSIFVFRKSEGNLIVDRSTRQNQTNLILLWLFSQPQCYSLCFVSFKKPNWSDTP